MTTALLTALTPGVFAERRDVITVSGGDGEAFLQGQISQDLESLVVGASAWSFVLQPGGKVDSFCRIFRTTKGFVIDVENGYGEALVQRLQRYCLRVDVEFALREEVYQCYRGPVNPDLKAPDGVPFLWGPLEGLDGTTLPAKLTKSVRELSSEEAECLRIAIGLPSLGAELSQSTIPAQIGVIDRAVSMTKGCYTGQELVTRIASRGGNVPSKLRVIAFDSSHLDEEVAQHVTPGDEIMAAPTPGRTSRKIGTITSVAAAAVAPVDGADSVDAADAAKGGKKEKGKPADDLVESKVLVALGFVRREVFPPYDAVVRTDNGDFPCRIVDIPAEGESSSD